MFIEQALSGKNNWSLYILTVLIVFLIMQIASLPLLIYMLITTPETLQNDMLDTVTDTNLGLVLTLLTFVAGFFALFFCVKYIHRKNYLDIVTSRPKFNWQRFFFGAGVWAILTLTTLSITIYTRENNEIILQFNFLTFIGLAIISLLLLPFQTAFEEIMFRGYLMQGFALFSNHAGFPLSSSPCFSESCTAPTPKSKILVQKLLCHNTSQWDYS